MIFTNDGKEYLTQSHLSTEVQDELFVRGGRVNLVELAKSLNVDLSQINAVAEQIAAENKDIHFILGQLIDETYVQRIASEINEKLSQNGEISVSDLTVQFDLPSDFLLHKVMEKYLNTIIMGRQDHTNRRIFFTQTFIERSRSKLRGALMAITRPTPVSAILAQCGIQERIFNIVFDDVSKAGSVTSRSPGAQYIPHIYTKTQSEWVSTFFKNNGYIEYDSVARLGVAEPKGFIQRQFPSDGKMIYLENCVIGSSFIEQIESALDECITTGGYLDVSTLLPSGLSDKDIDSILGLAINPMKKKSTLLVGTTVLTNQYLDEIIKPCYEILKTNVKLSVDSGKYQQYILEKTMSSGKNQLMDIDDDSKTTDKREERRKKAASGKAGGGAQGRETKTKSTKKHFRGGKGHDSESDDEQDNFNRGNKKGGGGKQITLELIKIDEIRKALFVQLKEEGLDELSKPLAEHFYPQLSKEALQLAQTMYESTLQNTNQSRRQTHAALQEKLNTIIGDIRLYEKGLKLLTPDLQTQLIKYLFKTLGNDIVNEIYFYVATESKLNFPDPLLTADQKLKITQECGQEYKTILINLNKTLVGTSIEEFLKSVESALQACSMVLKKVDKKKDRTIIHSHKLGLLEQLNKCSDPALVLHLAVLVIFTTSTQNMIHASGRHVSAILSYLQPVLITEQSKTLMNFHGMCLSSKIF